MKRSSYPVHRPQPALRVRRVLGLASLLLCPSLLGQETGQGAPPSSAPERTWIRNARIWTGESWIENGNVLLEGDRILAVSGSDAPGWQANVLDASGLTLVPGFVDAATDLLVEESARGGRVGGSELLLLDSIDAYADRPRERALRSGVVVVGIGRDAGTAEMGRSASLRVARAPRDPEAQIGSTFLLLRADQAGDLAAQPREGDSLIQLFAGAEKYHEEQEKYAKERAEYDKEKAEYDKKKAKEEKDGTDPAKSKLKEPKEPRKPKEDPGKAALFEAVEGRIAVIVSVRDDIDVQQALELRKRFGLRMALRGLARVEHSGEAIAAAGVPVILEREALLPNLELTRDPSVRRDLAGYLAESGVHVAIASGSNGRELAHHLVDLAAHARGAGLSDAQALQAITTVPAEILGLSKRVGAIREGLEANLVAFDGDPLSTRSKVRWVIAGGTKVQTADRAVKR